MDKYIANILVYFKMFSWDFSLAHLIPRNNAQSMLKNIFKSKV